MARIGILYVDVFFPFQLQVWHCISDCRHDQAVCAVMFVSTLAIVGLSFTKPRPHRVFHYITAAITLVASIAYFSMGSDLGQTPIAVQFHRSNSKVSGVNREIFYVRYIDWLVIRRCFDYAKCRLIWS